MSRRNLPVLLCLCLALPAAAFAQGNQFNTPGNVLISDQFNNRVIEVNPLTNAIVWQVGNGSPIAGPHSFVGVNDAQRVGLLTLVAGTSAPSGTEPGCSGPNGCPDNRVMLVDKNGNITWQYGQAGVAGSGFNQLSIPVQNTWLPDSTVLITDQANARIIRVNMDHQIIWQYGQTGVTGTGFNQLNNPNSAELLKNGHVLMADEGNNRVIEVNTVTHAITWSYGDPNNTSILNQPAFASRLDNGNTLIADGGNDRVVEVTNAGETVFTYYTNTRPGSITDPLPSRAIRLATGNTLISDQFNDQVIEVDIYGNIVYTQGQIATPGRGFDQLNAPYDAKVIGDWTGLTHP
jgi:hypothetical protein